MQHVMLGREGDRGFGAAGSGIETRCPGLEHLLGRLRRDVLAGGVHGAVVLVVEGRQRGTALAEGLLDGNVDGVHRLAREVGAVGSEGLGRVVDLAGTIELVLDEVSM